MCIQAVEVYRNPGSASNPGGHVVPRLSSEPVPAPTNQPMDPTGARAGLLTGRRQWQDPLRRSLEGPDRDRLARTQHPSIVSRSVAWCSTVSFRLSLAFVALVRQAATIATSLHTRHRSVVSVLLHHRHHHRRQQQQQQQCQHEGRQRRRPPRRQCQRKVNQAKEVASLAPPSAQDIATGEHPAGKRMHLLPPVDLTTKLVLLTMVLIAVVGHSEAGTCWLRRIESTGKCSQLFARNVTRESCCAAGSGAKGFSEKDITDVGLFFINAFNDGMECSSCLDTCDRAKCAPNKRCVMRRNRPKCICAPTCSGGGRGPKRNNRAHRMQQVQQQQQQHELQPHFHQQNIKVINLSESQRNRRQYFADDGRQPRPRQLRYTGPEVAGAVDRNAHRRSVKKSSLSEPRSPQSSQRAGAKHRAQDSDKERIDKEHNLLESVTLVSSSSGNSGNSRSSTSSSTSSSSSSSSSSISNSSSTSTSKVTHRPRPRPRSPQPIPVNCTASGALPTAGCPTSPSPASSSASSAPETPGWTGGERMVLLQHGPANGLALNHHPGKGSGRVKVHPAEPKTTPKPPTASSTGRHHRKVLAATPAANQTMMRAATHRNLPVNEPSHKSTVAPFAAFGKPKLLRVPKQGDGRHNGTARGTVRVPRREPQYLDDVFFVDNYHHRRNPHHREAAMDDFLGNEIMHSSFYNPVCGTDGKTYKTECQLKKRACRQEIASLVVAYKGHCQTSCKFVKCPDGQRCIEDQNASPHCVTCGGAECRSDRSPKSVVCGTDGITYPSICELKRQACLTGRAIPLAYRGRCIEAATCETIKCKDRQHCLTDLKTHKPRCVSCSYKCPRMKRQQGHGKPFRNARNNPYGEQSVKLCGTNNRTYHSWCHMQKDSCNTGFYIDVQHSGSCAFGR